MSRTSYPSGDDRTQPDPDAAGSPPSGPGQPSYGYPPTGYLPPNHPQATTALVLGILGLVLCGVLAPFAWWIGKRATTEIDASRGQVGGRGSAQAGYILGVIGTVLLGFSVLVVVLGVVGLIGALATDGVFSR